MNSDSVLKTIALNILVILCLSAELFGPLEAGMKSSREAPVTQRVTIESDRTNLGNRSSTALPKSESLSGNVQNLSEVSLIALEGKIKSVCVQAGLWAIFYGENYTKVGSILYTSGTPDDRACTTDPKNETNPQYKSIRHVGNLELSLEGISFYLGPFFTHQELYFDGTALNLNQPIKFRSFGFTGKENWTVFEDSDFSGSSACLVSAFTGGENEGKDIPYDTVVYNKDVNLTVGSLRKGCVQGLPNDQSKSIFILPTGEIKSTENVHSEGAESAVDTVEGLSLQDVTERKAIFTNGEELRLPFAQTLNVEYAVNGSSNWTIFSDTNFDGKRRCLGPLAKLRRPSAEATGGDDGNRTLTLKIGSIKRGCFLEGSNRQPRILQQPKTVEKIRKKNAEFYQSPSNRIFFTSFLIALGILILAIILGISIVFYFYCQMRREK